MPKPFPFPIQIATDICSVSRIRRLLVGKNGIDLIRRVLRPEERVENKHRCDGPVEKWRQAELMNDEKEKDQWEKYLGVSNVMTADDRLFAGVMQRLIKKDLREAEEKLGQAATFLAGRFAAKEAIIKAHHHRRLTFHDIIIRRPPDDESGSQAPIAIVLPEYGDEKDGQIVKISISHDTDFATAVCLASEEEPPTVHHMADHQNAEPISQLLTSNAPAWKPPAPHVRRAPLSLPPVSEVQLHAKKVVGSVHDLRALLASKSSTLQTHRGKPANFPNENTLRIRGFPPTMTNTELRTAFSRAVDVHRHPGTAYGFVTYVDSYMAIFEGATSIVKYGNKVSCEYIGGQVNHAMIRDQVARPLTNHGHDPYSGHGLNAATKALMMKAFRDEESLRFINNVSSQDSFEASNFPADRTVRLEGLPRLLDHSKQQYLTNLMKAYAIHNFPGMGAFALYKNPVNALRMAIKMKEFKFEGRSVECTYADPKVDLASIREMLQWARLSLRLWWTSLNWIVEKARLSDFEERDVTGKDCLIASEPDENLEEVDALLCKAQRRGSGFTFRGIHLEPKLVIRSIIVKIIEPSGDKHIRWGYEKFRKFIERRKEGNPKVKGTYRTGPATYYAVVSCDTAAAAWATAEKMDKTLFGKFLLRCRYLGEGPMQSILYPVDQEHLPPVPGHEGQLNGMVKRSLYQQPTIELNATVSVVKNDAGFTGGSNVEVDVLPASENVDVAAEGSANELSIKDPSSAADQFSDSAEGVASTAVTNETPDQEDGTSGTLHSQDFDTPEEDPTQTESELVLSRQAEEEFCGEAL